MTPVLEVEDLTVTYGHHRGCRPGKTVAVDGVTFSVEPATTFGLVGESGSGKTTLGRAVLGLLRPTAGRIRVGDHDVRPLSRRVRLEHRQATQVIFQDPAGSLNPARRVLDAIGEPLRIHQRLSRRDTTTAAEALASRVSLPPEVLQRLPHELSGGQCQRATIARALAAGPQLVVCDEPVTALDVSTQAQVINLLADVQVTSGVALLFISHDISVVRHVSHRIGVMYLGRMLEIGDADVIGSSPAHPYTRALNDAVPVPDPSEQRQRRARRRRLADQPAAAPLSGSAGCPYRDRCPLATEVCATDTPALTSVGRDHLVACHHADVTLSAGRP